MHKETIARKGGGAVTAWATFKNDLSLVFFSPNSKKDFTNEGKWSSAKYPPTNIVKLVGKSNLKSNHFSFQFFLIVGIITATFPLLFRTEVKFLPKDMYAHVIFSNSFLSLFHFP